MTYTGRIGKREVEVEGWRALIPLILFIPVFVLIVIGAILSIPATLVALLLED